MTLPKNTRVIVSHAMANAAASMTALPAFSALSAAVKAQAKPAMQQIDSGSVIKYGAVRRRFG